MYGVHYKLPQQTAGMGYLGTLPLVMNAPTQYRTRVTRYRFMSVQVTITVVTQFGDN